MKGLNWMLFIIINQLEVDIVMVALLRFAFIASYDQLPSPVSTVYYLLTVSAVIYYYKILYVMHLCFLCVYFNYLANTFS